jgi:hypothetical protein
VVDARFASTNNGKVLALARVDILFMEAAFMQTNAVVAAKRGHLTADQAGTLAREARSASSDCTIHHGITAGARSWRAKPRWLFAVGEEPAGA